MENFLQKILAVLVVLLFSMTTVAAADITLTYPTGGEYIANEAGSIPITWDYNTLTNGSSVCGAGTDSVTIQYYNGASWIELTRVASAKDTTFDWLTGALPDNSIYQVRLVSTCNSPDDISSAFTLDSVSPTISSTTLLTPNGGQNLMGGSSYEITWDNTDITDTNLGSNPISLYYSLNNGASWSLIASGETNDGSYTWTVPSVDTTTALVLIEATDLAGHSVSDQSDSVFTIDSTVPSVTGISYSDTEISQADDGEIFTADISYSEDMDTSVDPTVTFSPAVADTMTSCSGSWMSSDKYDYSCTIDASAGEEAQVDVMTADAQDIAGNVQEASTDSEALWVDTLAPTVLSATASPDPTSGDVTITTVFSEAMGGDPYQELLIDGDDGIYLSNGDGYWTNPTTWVESFSLTGSESYPDSTGVIQVRYGEDLIGNEMIANDDAGEFSVDTVAPSAYDASFDDSMIGSADAMDTSFSYTGAEDPSGATYYYTINDTDGGSVWGSGVVGDSSGTVPVDVSALSDGTLTLHFWLVDGAGNMGDVVSDSAEKDSVAPGVVSITTSEDVSEGGDGAITESDGTFWVWVQYDESMTGTPTVSFNPTLSGTLSCISDGWDTNVYTDDTYIYACSVTDNDVEVSNVDVSASGAQDTFGNDQVDYTRDSAFNVDLIKPTVTNVDVYPEPAAAGPVTLTLTFSEDMNTSVPLAVEVDGLVSSPYTVTGDFTDSNTWVGTFDLADDNEIGSLATVFINDGQDVPGNVMEENSWTFSIDTVNFYALDVPGNGVGFTQTHPGFWLSLNQLEATDLSDYDVNTVLDASAGPLSERLNHSDVSMVWAYDVANETWASYDVTDGTGDFSSFGWTSSPAWYELDLLSSGQYKSIRHDGAEA